MIQGKIKTNILIQYTIISFLVTIIIATTLSILLINKTKNQMILVHADFYKAFVSEIPHNYAEILPLIAPERYGEVADEHSIEGHHDDGSEDIWYHFMTDILQYPSVDQFRIFLSYPY